MAIFRLNDIPNDYNFSGIKIAPTIESRQQKIHSKHEKKEKGKSDVGWKIDIFFCSTNFQLCFLYASQNYRYLVSFSRFLNIVLRKLSLDIFNGKY
jgi:hypothetical protein